MINAYRDAGRDLFSLLPKQSTRPPKKRTCWEVYQIMRSVVTKDYNTKERPAGSLVVKNVTAEIDKANEKRLADGPKLPDYPSDRSIYREIANLAPYEVAVQRHGKAKANAKFGSV